MIWKGGEYTYFRPVVGREMLEQQVGRKKDSKRHKASSSDENPRMHGYMITQWQHGTHHLSQTLKLPKPFNQQQQFLHLPPTNINNYLYLSFNIREPSFSNPKASIKPFNPQQQLLHLSTTKINNFLLDLSSFNIREASFSNPKACKTLLPTTTTTSPSFSNPRASKTLQPTNK
jgi:hypothetical protein